MSLWDGIFGRRKVKLTDPASWHVDSGNAANKSVTPDSAMQLSAAWACVRRNATTGGSLPIKIYERRSAGERIAADGHPLYALLHDTPNADQTAMEFWEGQLTALNLRGNAYAQKYFDHSGKRLVALVPMNPDLVTVMRSVTGARVYSYRDQYGGGRAEPMGEDEVFHLRGFGAGGAIGLSPIAYGRQTLGTAIAADEVAGKTFANGLQLSGFIEMVGTAKITDDQRAQLVALFQKFAGSSQSGKVMPLDPGMKFTALGMNPEDAQLLETRRFHVEEICRWFGVPPILVGHAGDGQTMWGTGVEAIVLAWLVLGLGPELERIEQAIAKQLMAPGDRGKFYAEHNVDSLLRADSAGRAALYASAGQNGWMNRNEIRAKENLPPRPGGEVLTVQSNLMALDQIGKVPARAVQPAPGEPV